MMATTSGEVGVFFSANVDAQVILGIKQSRREASKEKKKEEGRCRTDSYFLTTQNK